MSTLAAKITDAHASEIWFDPDMLHVRLLDGREISVPIEWFPIQVGPFDNIAVCEIFADFS